MQAAVPRAGGRATTWCHFGRQQDFPSPRLFTHLERISPGLLVGKGDCCVVSLKLRCLGDLGPCRERRRSGVASFWLPACLSVCPLLFPLFLALFQLSLHASLFLYLFLGPGSLSPSFSPPLLSPLSRFFSFLSGEQRRSALPRGMSSKKLQF